MSRAESVAVIVPCYNAAGTLAAAIDSAIGQAGLDVAVIVVDDGSTDGSAAVATSYGQRLTFLSGPNNGVSAARNAGLRLATTDWVVFLDADDRLEPGTLEKGLVIAKATRADVVISAWIDVIADRDGRVRRERHRHIDWPSLELDAENAIAAGAWATTAAILYRRALVEQIGGFRLDLPIIQDARLLFDAAYHGARLAPADHVGARYLIQEGSLSRRDCGAFHRDLLTNGLGIERLWRATGRLDGERHRLLRDIYDLAGRGLLRAEDAKYFDAVAAQRRLGLPTSRHARIAPVLARAVGLRQAQTLLSLAGRA